MHKEYASKVLTLTQTLKIINVPCDISMADTQKYMNILTTNEPWIYQANSIDKPDMSTVTNFNMYTL